MNNTVFSTLCQSFFPLIAVALLLNGCVNTGVDEDGAEESNQRSPIRPDITNKERPTASLKVNVGIIHEARELDLINEVWSSVNDIYRQCDIAVSVDTQNVELAATRVIDRETRIQLSEDNKNASPTVFYVPSTNEADIAFAYLPSYDSPLASTSWISNRVSERCLAWITAHELGHVLLNSGSHSNGSFNVMSRGCKLGNWNNQEANPKWSAEQCSALRGSPFINPE